jgi:hypothetical protein
MPFQESRSDNVGTPCCSGNHGVHCVAIAAFTMVIDNTGVRSHADIKTSQQRRLLSRFQRIRFVEGKVTICGRTNENGQFQRTFVGPTDEATKQQVRDYLVNEL